MFREILPEGQRQEMTQKVLEQLQAPLPAPVAGQEGAPVPDAGEPPASMTTREPTFEELGWKTLLFDSDFKVGDSTKELSFVAPPGPVTNATRFQVDSITENNTVRHKRIPNLDLMLILKLNHSSDQVHTTFFAHR